MGYPRNPQVVEGVLPYLDRMLKGEPCEWVFDTYDQAQRFAYRLRAAMFVAQENAETYPDLALARQRFSLRFDRQNNIVRAVPRAKAVPSASNPVTTIPGAKIVSGSLQVEGRQSPMAIIQAWMSRPAGTTKLSFPEAGLNEGEIATVAKWAKQRVTQDTPSGWMVISNPPVLVLTVWDEDLTSIAETPEA